MQHSFCHLPGIGVASEKRLWASGIHTWDDLLAAKTSDLPFSGRRAGIIHQQLERSRSALASGDVDYFADAMPSGLSWRLFPEFRDRTAYLDIETTGMGDPDDYITAISLYNGRSVSTYVHGRNMDDFEEDVKNYEVIVTYNGKCFDVPFIRGHLGVEMSHAQIDLRYVLKRLGYGGGLKGCEKKLGLGRDELDGVDGYFAVLLWREYCETGDPRVLETLLAYNAVDTVNLETLMVLAYNMNLKDTPFAESLALPLPRPPEIPFTADRGILEAIRSRMTAYSFF